MGRQDDVGAAAAAIRDRLATPVPHAVIVLGSGLGGLAERLEDRVRIAWHELPGFAASGVAGHSGELVFGRLSGKTVVCQSGRVHLYEGHRAGAVAFPVRVYARLGIRTLILTNAAGSLRASLGPGSLVLLADQINFMFQNPLIGPQEPAEIRFPDMSAPFDPELREAARDIARRENIRLEEGVYVGVPGPSYETPAEIRLLARLGADVVGMSTIPEVVAARARGLRCLGLSTVTNLASGLGPDRLKHEDVIRVGAETGERLGRLVSGVVAALR